MTAEENEHIDVSLWLKRDEPIITPERAAKGDIRAFVDDTGCIRHAEVIPGTVLVWLYQHRVLTAQHLHCARIFELWRNCATAALGYRNNPVYASEMPMVRKAVESDGLDVNDYEALIALLKPTQRRIIAFAIDALAADHPGWLHESCHKAYWQSFNRLAVVMDELREKAEAKKRAEESACAQPEFVS